MFSGFLTVYSRVTSVSLNYTQYNFRELCSKKKKKKGRENNISFVL